MKWHWLFWNEYTMGNNHANKGCNNAMQNTVCFIIPSTVAILR